jgi:anti-sigma regulatory factor (Ser/Thr protein kinase)
VTGRPIRPLAEVTSLEIADSSRPPTFKVLRYRVGAEELEVVVGDDRLPLKPAELTKLARNALAERTFVAHTVPDDDGGELCFVPRDDHCDILSIRADVRRRHHGDHRRSPLEILNDLAAAVACGRLRFLTQEELRAEVERGEVMLSRPVTDSATLAAARSDVADALAALGFSPDRREETILCLSEAATNALVHGGGRGTLTLLDIGGPARLLVADAGPGLNFLNWQEPGGPAQASMGYGYHIILDHIDDVCLNTSPEGTTLILDQHPRRPEVMSAC